PTASATSPSVAPGWFTQKELYPSPSASRADVRMISGAVPACKAKPCLITASSGGSPVRYLVTARPSQAREGRPEHRRAVDPAPPDARQSARTPAAAWTPAVAIDRSAVMHAAAQDDGSGLAG